MTDTLTPQEQLFLEQKYHTLKMVDQANDSLDRKATNLLQIIILIIALVSLLSIPNLAQGNPTVLTKAGIAVASLAFIVMLGLSILAWLPGRYPFPGPSDFDQAYDKYILASKDDCYNQILSDLLETIELIQELNSRKGKLITSSTILLVVQSSGLIVAILS